MFKTKTFLLTIGLGLAAAAVISHYRVESQANYVSTPAAPSKVIVVGIDGATFKVLLPLVESGQLPHFERLLREGARGTLRSRPLALSPSLWTTIATGVEAEQHGIPGFTLTDPATGEERLVRSTDRRAPALWDLAGIFHKTVGVIGYWASWPAEKINGFDISYNYTAAPEAGLPADADSDLTYPPELAEALAAQRITPDRLRLQDFMDLMPLSPEEFHKLASISEPKASVPLSVVKFIYPSQLNVENFTLAALAEFKEGRDKMGRVGQKKFHSDIKRLSDLDEKKENGQKTSHLFNRQSAHFEEKNSESTRDPMPALDQQPDLFLIYLQANDGIGHTFWHWYQPEQFEGVNPREAAQWGDMIPAVYRHNDRFLGRVMELMEPGTTLLIVSDHGMGPNPLRRSQAEARPGEHEPDGIFMAWGSNIRPGRLNDADLLDVAPTILALLGLPATESMAGRVVEEALTDSFRRAFPPQKVRVEFVAPTENHAREPNQTVSLQMKNLRALGYLK